MLKRLEPRLWSPAVFRRDLERLDPAREHLELEVWRRLKLQRLHVAEDSDVVVDLAAMVRDGEFRTP